MKEFPVQNEKRKVEIKLFFVNNDWFWSDYKADFDINRFVAKFASNDFSSVGVWREIEGGFSYMKNSKNLEIPENNDWRIEWKNLGNNFGRIACLNHFWIYGEFCKFCFD